MPTVPEAGNPMGSSFGSVRVRSARRAESWLAGLPHHRKAPRPVRHREGEEDREVEEKLAPSGHGPSAPADHQVLQPTVLDLGHLLEPGRKLLDLGRSSFEAALGSEAATLPRPVDDTGA